MEKKMDFNSIKIKESERLLLHAILEDDDDLSFSYYAKWSKRVPFDNIENGSYMLIPMLYRRYSDNKQSYDNKEKIIGIYRNSLYRNHMLFSRCLEAVSKINNQGIRTIVLKGAALTAAYYHDCGLRLMNDMDILVEESDINEAIKILENLGWKQEELININKMIKAYHAVHLFHEDGYEMDLHWAISDYWFRTETGKEHRFTTERTTLTGHDIEILSPTYQVLHNCLHGSLWNQMSPVRWIVDVITVLEKRENDIDWDLLIKETEAEKISFIMASKLGYLFEEFKALVPKEVLKQLELIPKDKEEMQFFHSISKEPTFANIGQKWRAYLYVNRDQLKNKSFFTKCLLFPEYLKTVWALESRMEIPKYMLKRGINKLIER